MSCRLSECPKCKLYQFWNLHYLAYNAQFISSMARRPSTTFTPPATSTSTSWWTVARRCLGGESIRDKIERCFMFTYLIIGVCVFSQPGKFVANFPAMMAVTKSNCHLNLADCSTTAWNWLIAGHKEVLDDAPGPGPARHLYSHKSSQRSVMLNF